MLKLLYKTSCVKFDEFQGENVHLIFIKKEVQLLSESLRTSGLAKQILSVSLRTSGFAKQTLSESLRTSGLTKQILSEGYNLGRT